MVKKTSLVSCVFMLFRLTALPAQEPKTDWQELKKSAPNVFLDCSSCDTDYIKTEIVFVNYVRDRREADVHVFITTQATASGSTEYTIAFIGQDRFNKQNLTLKYYTNPTNTADEIRSGLVKTLRTGLVSYVAQTPLADLVTVGFQLKPSTHDVKDKWRHWVFHVAASGDLSKNNSRRVDEFAGSVSASRITPDIKMNFHLYGSSTKSSYKQNFNGQESSFSAKNHCYGIDTMLVKSLGEHWSVGGNAFIASYSASSNDLQVNDFFSNESVRISQQSDALSYQLALAVEYDIFPYSESTHKLLTLFYEIGVLGVDDDPDMKDESHVYHALGIHAAIVQPWGSIYGSLKGYHNLDE